MSSIDQIVDAESVSLSLLLSEKGLVALGCLAPLQAARN
jgi:hypothetical protein